MLKSNHLRAGISTLVGRLHLRRAGRRKGAVQWTQTSWGRRFMQSATMALALMCMASVALADLKVTTRSSASGQSATSTTYIKGARQRTEGMGFTTIYQCDLKRMIQINDKARTYLITPYAGGDKTQGAQKTGAARKGGVITYRTTNTDTGERKNIFGLPAKHIKSRMVVEASEGACNSMNMQMETDGWYVDLPGGGSCPTDGSNGFPSYDSDCVDEVVFKTEGAANTGYPVMTTTTIRFTGTEMNIPASTSNSEVVDISKAALDQALFEIPAGYREVKTSQEMGSPY
jgi:hypothetical protein